MRFVVVSCLAILFATSCKKKEAAPPKAPVSAAAPAPAPAPGTAPAAPAGYKPRYAQRMFEVLQRFQIAGAASQKGNWGLVHQQAYELLETFRGDLPHVLPAVRIPTGVDLKGLRSAYAETQLTALLAAAEKRDRATFEKAYKEAAAGCNACHNQVDRKFIIIREVPQRSIEDQLDIGAGAGK